ncbi:hydantoinase/oxoprolinase family protein [Calditerricola satsumensis]|uniref:5-oxoprolinase n=1 Tax=Calditerricola satsumensis TaxID=373054 RepID=A0A8J3BJ98_9BACI|nr:hydantoinase/oxoprolinase family protein [Calditerricola satsumensis]GGK07475.1 5-oxoprolinase [Calditerricola satsumensis]
MRVATDIGGTFTDLVYLDDQGRVGMAKTDTTPPDFEEGVVNVLRKSGIDPRSVTTLIHGTTVIINALTERKGVKTGLLTTKGFRDVLEIGRGNRPDLFNLRYQKPVPFVPRYLRFEVEERINSKGEVLVPLNRDDIVCAVEFFKREGVEAVAVAYLHAYANPAHERETVALIRERWPEVAVTASHEVTREWREYERTSTTVLNAYVKPIAANYVDRLEQKLRDMGVPGKLYIMQSNGGTTTFAQAKETPINMVESGPVAGIFGAAMLGKLLGQPNVIAFDVGGTTAKCSLVDNGEVTITTEYRIERDERRAGYPIKVPVVDIVEIGNGGGSIAWIDEAGALKVGPQSAGAFPGPVAYGRGGAEPTTTDANLVTGRLNPANFHMPVDMDAVRRAIDEKIARHFGVSVEEAALGILRIANANMLNALKLISVRKGYDPRDFALVAFGGGGALHATALARELGVKKVIVPVAASVFSAWGMLMTDLRRDWLRTDIRRVQDLDLDKWNALWNEMEYEALQWYREQGFADDQVVFVRHADMRYLGQEHTVKVPVPGGNLTPADVEEVIRRFHAAHEKRYSFKLEYMPTEIVNVHVVAFGRVQKPELAKFPPASGSVEDAKKGVRPVYFEEVGWVETALYERDRLGPGMMVEGPAIVEEPTTATVLYPGQTLQVDPYGNLIVETGA